MTQQAIWGLASIVSIIALFIYGYLLYQVSVKGRAFTVTLKNTMSGLLGLILFIDIFFSEMTTLHIAATIATAMMLAWNLDRPAIEKSSSSSSSQSRPRHH
jgi:hypothetical protein